jgi:hypothetical protein
MNRLKRKEIFCMLLSIMITLMSCSPKTSQLATEEKMDKLKEANPPIEKEVIVKAEVLKHDETIEVVEEEEEPMFVDTPVEEEEPMFLDAPVEEEMPMFVDAPVEEEEEVPTFVDQTYEGQIKYVSSDLRKEFPKKDHIRIAKQLGVEIEDIYYYNNASQVLAIYVNTAQVLDENKLKEIQTKMYQLLWDFSGAKITTIVKKGGTPYAIISSRKGWEDGLTIMVYDYKSLMTELAGIKKEIMQAEDFAFETDKIFGVYFDPGLLSSKKKSKARERSIDFIIEKDGGYTSYFTIIDKFGLYKQRSLSKGSNDLFYDYENGSTIQVCPDGNLLFRSTNSNFKEKYSNFKMKVD